MKPKNPCLYYYCHSSRIVLGTEQGEFHKHPGAHSQQTWQADSWTSYTEHTDGRQKSPRRHPPPVLEPPDLPVRAVRGGHHPARAQHGGPAHVPGAQGQCPGAAACQHTIREARGLAPHSANRQAPVRWTQRRLSAGECGRLPFIIPSPKHGAERPSR